MKPPIVPEETLLGHIGVALADHPELVATKSLAFVLQNSQTACKALSRFLKTHGPSVGEGLSYRHQDSETQSIPDIVGRDRWGRQVVIVEAKFWAGFTEQQPSRYLALLPKDRAGVVLFIAPRLRTESLWRQIIDDSGWTAVKVRSSGDVRAACLSRGHWVVLTSWSTLLNRLMEALNDAHELVMVANVQQLSGLCSQMDAEGFLPLRQEELGPEFPRRYLQLRNLVTAVTNQALEAGFAKLKIHKVTLGSGSSTEYSGRYLYLGGVGTWFGLHYQWWAKKHPTPLWVEVGGKIYPYDVRDVQRFRTRLKRWENAESPRLLLSDAETPIIPLECKVGDEEDDIKRSLLKQLKEIATALKRG